MDKILNTLQGKAFNLPEPAFNFLADRYSHLTAFPFPELDIDSTHPEFFSRLLTTHREQFLTEDYIQNRINYPVSGTIDHLHAEITSYNAAELGKRKGYSGYAVGLLRASGHLHDSDRSYPETMVPGEEDVRHDPAAYREYKLLHADNSKKTAERLARTVSDKGFHYAPGLMSDLGYLILRHERGGVKENGKCLFLPSEVDEKLNLNELADIVTNADSISYFDANILTNWQECGRKAQILGNKVHFMYDRMTEDARDYLNRTILQSREHVLGPDCSIAELKDIRNILLDICG